jgi:hypothetical protein
MASLSGFERLVESLIERSLIAPLRGKVQPIEIAKRLERTLREGSLLNVGASLAPNEYVVRLNPEDFQPLAAARTMLERELSRHLARIGAERGFAFLAPPTVRIVADPAVSRRAIETRGELREPGSAAVSVAPPPAAPHAAPAGFGEPDIERTMVRPATISSGRDRPPPTAQRTSLGLDFGTWQVQLAPGVVRIGRAPDCDVVVPSPRVSRHHAELAVEADEVVVRDLNSTNGTTVEGRPVRESPLRPGERVAFGGVEARLIEHGAEVGGSGAAVDA